MTGLQIAGAVLGLIVSALAIFVALAKLGNYVLSGFHNEHVAPVIKDITHELRQNTSATSGLTAALARTDESAREERQQTHETFERMGRIAEEQRRTSEEHEAWLRRHDVEIGQLQEAQDVPRARPRIRGRKP